MRTFQCYTALFCSLLCMMPVQAGQDPADEVVTAIVDDVVETTIKAKREKLTRAMEAPATPAAESSAPDARSLPWLIPGEQRRRAREPEIEQERELRELEAERNRELAKLWNEYRREAAKDDNPGNMEKLRRKLEQKQRFFERKREWILNKARKRRAD